jgi:hypothetical protein
LKKLIDHRKISYKTHEIQKEKILAAKDCCDGRVGKALGLNFEKQTPGFFGSKQL